jgi:hypothetical protein
MLGMFRHYAQEVLPEIPVPVLVLTGDRDYLTVPTAGEYIAETVPEGVVQQFTTAGHLTLLEKHSALTASVQKFCRDSLLQREAVVSVPGTVEPVAGTAQPSRPFPIEEEGLSSPR